MRQRSKLAVFVAALGAVAATSWGVSAFAEETSTKAQAVPEAFTGAAKEFGVPEELLKAYSLSLTGGEDHGKAPSAQGGFGLMHLTSPDAVDESGRGAETPGRDKHLAADPTANTLTRAAELTGESPEQLQSDPVQNIRGGAAVLADEAKKAGAKPARLDDWFPIVNKLTGSAGSTNLAEDVFTQLKQGATGGQIKLEAHADVKFPARPKSDAGAECPSTLACKFLPAAYASNNPADANDYGNYDPANRPSKDTPIKYIVIHDTEGVYQGTLDMFQDPTKYKSAHYVIRSEDGEVTQMVKNKDIAWHAGSWTMNTQSIGLEHEAIAVDGAQWYTDAMYRSSSQLVKFLAAKYDIPLDRQHIIGHNDIGNPSDFRDSHWDPGPFWDWDKYMRLLGARPQAPGRQLVTISPQFATNQPELQYCNNGCRPVPAQPTNEVLLRTEPRDDAPLLTDKVVTSGDGTNDITDWSNKAVTGRQYAVAERQGKFTAIWFAGQKAWLHSDVLRPAAGKTITPKPGVEAQVFAEAFPEASEWPEGTPAGNPTTPPKNPSAYTISGAQKYQLSEEQQAAYFYARFADNDVPLNNTLITGATKYLRISFHHRFMYVKADDVVVS